jgi:UDP-N-acetylmuramate: L-alanyl-gamma-D-glutamyl-meso-diaminopimelate ligase
MFAEIKSVHFVGIGGTAMAAVAAAMRDKGFAVTGSDQNVYPPMSTFLAAKEIEVMQGYAESNLARKPDLVVIGNAISRGNPEAEAVLEQKLRYCSLPELLKEFFIRGKRSLVVSGTHGKTTTTSLLAWVFEHNGLQPGFLIGGIPNNFAEGARFTDSPWFIIEGDEYDTAFFDKRSKFVHYLPEVVIINNLGIRSRGYFRESGRHPNFLQAADQFDSPQRPVAGQRRRSQPRAACSTSRIARSNASGLGRGQQRPGLQSALRPDGQRV